MNNLTISKEIRSHLRAVYENGFKSRIDYGEFNQEHCDLIINSAYALIEDYLIEDE